MPRYLYYLRVYLWYLWAEIIKSSGIAFEKTVCVGTGWRCFDCIHGMEVMEKRISLHALDRRSFNGLSNVQPLIAMMLDGQ
jgi:hypothetical protein